MDAVLKFFGSIAQLTTEESQIIQSRVKKVYVKKGGFFVKQGQVCTRVGFVNNGLIRLFLSKHSQEINLAFLKEGEVATSIESCKQKLPSTENFQAIEDTELHVMEYDDLVFLAQRYHSVESIYRSVVERYLLISLGRVKSFLFLTSEQRYEQFVRDYPELIQRIPQRHLASFLGVHEKSLSRLRKSIYNKVRLH